MKVLRFHTWPVLFVSACAPHPQGTQAPPALYVGRVDSVVVVGVVTAAAAGAYAVGGGCKIAGCPTHLACNPGNERCEAIACTPRGPACPPGSICERSSGRCQTQPPPTVLPER
jgi:hypothetical protein